MTAPAAAPPRPGDLLELVAGEAAHGGWCVARTASSGAGSAGQDGEGGGRVVFVRHALPGERVRARVTQATARFARADAVEILEPSPDRVPPPCPHARPGGCGGCDWQHASLPAQRALKATVIRQQLRRIAGIDRDVIVEPVDGDAGGLGWRTRVRFAVRKDGTAGLRQHRSHAIVPVQHCPIGHDLVNDSGAARERWRGARSVEVAAAPGPGQDGQAGQVTVLADGALARGPQFLERHAAGRAWRTGAATFWQVHPGAATTLAAAVLDAVRPAPGDTVLDLYCGAGLFAGVLADAVGPDGTVIGIEADTGAVRDARRNLRSTPWARIHKGDAAAMLGRYGVSGASLAVLDPPRTGADRAVTDILAAAGPSGPLQRIAYVSCDPATLARDLAIFGQHGWDLTGLRAFDMFPMTHHVECLAVLTPW
jgi:tRNA/tmRNA/rRNA uracil-C5-methylase (TrmA/RlmC/RlmD family)